MSVIIRRAAAAAGFSVLALCCSLQAAEQVNPARKVIALDRIIAIVNDDVITKQELDDRVALARKELRDQNTPEPPAEVLARQTLERMIYMRVQLQYAKETGLRVDDAALDAAINRIAEGNKMRVEQLRDTLEKDGMRFAQFREDIRDEIAVSRLREREVDNKIIITDSEVDSLLASSQGPGATPEEYNLLHILVRVPEQASPEQLQARRARAEQALGQIKAGTDFRQVAASFSDAPDAVQGGAMGWREFAQLPTLFAQAAKVLKAGEVSTILSSPNGFHILRLLDRRTQGAPLMVSQTHARHILIKTSELVSEADARDRVIKLKERLDNNADFAELARLQSEDASASRGGDLGWLSPGDTVPEFENAMNALKAGEISAPVRTPFGWHLVQALERRNQDMSQEQQRLRARQALRVQKSDEAYQEWVRQLHDKAFVQYRLEDK